MLISKDVDILDVFSGWGGITVNARHGLIEDRLP